MQHKYFKTWKSEDSKEDLYEPKYYMQYLWTGR